MFKLKLKSATKFTLFSTVLMTVGNLIFYLCLFIVLRERLGESFFLVSEMLVMLVAWLLGIAAISFFVSSLVVDKILNPVRVMISKVRDIGERNFTGRLVIDSEEDELREYAYAFNEMAMKINGYIEKQKCFVSDASHELSTPITIINGHADMLLRWGREDPDRLEESLTVIKGEALRMNTLVEDLLFFARSDNQKQVYHFTPADLGELAASCAGEAQLLYPEYEISCVCAQAYIIRCDTEAIKRVFRILINNAVKYGGDNKSLEINITGDDGMVHATVKDRGAGLPETELERIFDRFYRVDDSRAKKTGGTGLGLSIAQEIIRSHNGKIWAENNPEGGAAIQIDLHQTFTF